MVEKYVLLMLQDELFHKLVASVTQMVHRKQYAPRVDGMVSTGFDQDTVDLRSPGGKKISSFVWLCRSGIAYEDPIIMNCMSSINTTSGSIRIEVAAAWDFGRHQYCVQCMLVLLSSLDTCIRKRKIKKRF